MKRLAKFVLSMDRREVENKKDDLLRSKYMFMKEIDLKTTEDSDESGTFTEAELVIKFKYEFDKEWEDLIKYLIKVKDREFAENLFYDIEKKFDSNLDYFFDNSKDGKKLVQKESKSQFYDSLKVRLSGNKIIVTGQIETGDSW